MGFFQKVLGKITHNGSLAVKWEYDAKSAVTTNPTCVDINGDGKEEILFGTQKGQIICLTHEGKKLWEYDARKQFSKKEAIFMDKSVIDSIYSQPVVINLRAKEQGIVFGNEAGVVTCLDHQGRKLWELEAKGGIRGAPYAYDFDKDGQDEIIVGSRDKNLYVISSKGKIKWKFEAPSGIESTAAISHGKKKRIIFGCNDGHVIGLSLQGKKIWSYKTDGKVHAQPVVYDFNGVQRIIVGSSDGHLYVLNEEGVLEWNYRTKGRILSRVMLADVDKDKEPEFFFGSCDDHVHALAANSQAMWTYETGFWVGAPVYVTDVDGNGTVEVIAGSYDKHVYVLEAMGSFSLDYMPGLSGVVQQSGNYSDFLTSEPGKLIGKVIWKHNVNDIIISLNILHETTHRNILAGTKGGKLICLEHRK